MGRIFNARNQAMSQMQNIPSITVGTVMDTNDPQQQGRLRIMCPSLGDDNNSESADHLPWATYSSNFGGMVNANMLRGPNEGSTSQGPVAYGMINIPKRGASVLVACIDGDPYYRVWCGVIMDQGSINALPHGRFFYQKTAGVSGNGEPEGPLNSYEQPIEPLYSNMAKAYGSKAGNFEWRTRGADFSVGGNKSDFTQLAPSNVPDETTKTTFTSEDGKTFDVQNGYAQNRLQGFEQESESTVYSWTSPGFHSISMDDRPENCRIRIRTTSGTQLLLDDTNERIYLSNAEGSNWFEMDFDGNIDVYAQTRINLHAESDVNITSDQSVRIQGKNGVYIQSGQDVVIEAGANASVKGGTNAFLQGGEQTNVSAGGELLLSAPSIHANGPQAAPGMQAKLTNRIPQHEPWARGTTKGDFDQSPKFSYNDPGVGSEDKTRGKFWRR